MRSHPLKGVEPELFSPEELLGGPRRALPSTSRPAFASQTPPQTQQTIHRSDSETSDRQSGGSWFQLPWRLSPQDDAPHSRRTSRDDRGLPLHHPPLVGCICLNLCVLVEVVCGCESCGMAISGTAVLGVAAEHSDLQKPFWVRLNAVKPADSILSHTLSFPWQTEALRCDSMQGDCFR